MHPVGYAPFLSLLADLVQIVGGELIYVIVEPVAVEVLAGGPPLEVGLL